MVNSWIFKNDESETDAKTNSRHQVCPLLAWRVHAQSPLLEHYVHTQGGPKVSTQGSKKFLWDMSIF